MNNGLKPSKFLNSVTLHSERQGRTFKKYVSVNDSIMVKGEVFRVIEIQIYGGEPLVWCDVNGRKVPYIGSEIV